MAAPAGVHIRRDAWSLPPGDLTLVHYANAVKAMKERPATNPTSWSYQAAIHGSLVLPALELWNQCKHGSWWFVAWHRMFVYYFEQIVRAAVEETAGPSDWALPYWNYGRNGEYASMPLPFRNPTENGVPNPLYVAQRAPGINSGARLPPAVTTDAFALSRPQFTGAAEFGGGVAPPAPQFYSQTGRLEQTPHNDVHNAVGKGGWMANPFLAAQDPIFWLHHSNIDRIWAIWIAEGHVDPSDNGWLGQRFAFYDAEGKKITKSCAEVRDTAVDLNYTYDPPPAPSAPALLPAAVRPQAIVLPPTSPEPRVVGATAQGVTLVGNTADIPVEIDEQARQDVLAASTEADPRRLFLNVEDIEGEVNPGSVYGIYVNLPDTPSPADLSAHHIGNVSFFGIERARDPQDDEHPHNLRVSVEVGELVNALSTEGRWDLEQMHVSFRPLSLIPPAGSPEPAEPAGEDPPVHIGRVSLSVG